MDYQKVYEVKKAQKLLNKHGILDPAQEQKITDEIQKEKAKAKEKKNGVD